MAFWVPDSARARQNFRRRPRQRGPFRSPNEAFRCIRGRTGLVKTKRLAHYKHAIAKKVSGLNGRSGHTPIRKARVLLGRPSPACRGQSRRQGNFRAQRPSSSKAPFLPCPVGVLGHPQQERAAAAVLRSAGGRGGDSARGAACTCDAAHAAAQFKTHCSKSMCLKR